MTANPPTPSGPAMGAPLLPCPFCGGEAEACGYNSCDCCGKAWNGQVICQGCGQGVSHYDTDAEAITAWNTRAPDPATAKMREAAQALIEAHGDTKGIDFVGWCQVLAEKVDDLREALTQGEAR